MTAIAANLDSRLSQLVEPPLTPPPELFDPPRPIDNGLIDAGLGDFVWIDANGNGLQDEGNGPFDPGEVGLNGVRVRLLTLDGELVAETTTAPGPADVPGWYAFEDIDFAPPEPGIPFTPPSYIIEVEAPAGFSFTRQDADPAQYLVGESPIDSDVDPETGRLETGPLNPQGVPGAQIFTLDVGLVPDVPASEGAGEGAIGDRVWLDSNRNGLQDEGEPGVNGITVRLFGEEGEFVAAAVTANDANGEAGFYRFEGLQAASFTELGLQPGERYQVEFELPQGYAFTVPNADPAPLIDSESDRDSDVDPDTGRLVTRELTNFIGGFSAVQFGWDAGLLAVDQTVSGSAAAELLRGGSGADYLTGQAAADRLLGRAGDDVLSGGAGNDALFGQSGSDVLLGGGGSDRLRGTRLMAQASQVDVLQGGAGEDLFILGDRRGAFYTDGGDADQALIVDFEIGEDRIRAFGTAADYRVESDFTQSRLFRGSELVATLYTGFGSPINLARDVRFTG